MVTAVKSSITRLGLNKNNAIPPHLVVREEPWHSTLLTYQLKKIRMFGHWKLHTDNAPEMVGRKTPFFKKARKEGINLTSIKLERPNENYR